ncbi:lipid II:glycine glycyltransferase FemX [Feifania hominis]|uniref:lipid II:glycine glycyltransferase FemX n=1 Tax=Feifania hominis TaxID=2763660 RepID=UPI002015EBCA
MERITADHIEEYEAFLAAHPKGHFMQSVKWGKVKTAWRQEILVRRDAEGRIAGSLALLIRKVPGMPWTMMYCPRGPVCDIHDREMLAGLVADARELAKVHHSYELKIDPDVAVTDAAFVEALRSLGFTQKQTGKNFEGIQPKFVFRLNVEGKTEDEVMALFHSKTRYNIRVAIKNNVTVEIGGREDLKKFYEIMLETGMRDNFVTRSLTYFETMYDALGENCRLYVARYEGEIIAGTLAIWYGDKVWYLYGASSNAHRNVMPNYLLQWAMIRWAIEKGCRIYDFRGVSGDLDESNPLYGLYRFKKGFNGDFVEFVGEFDLILNNFAYFAVEKGQKVYKKMIKTVYKIKNRDKAVRK